MYCPPKNPAMRRFSRRIVTTMAWYATTLILALLARKHLHPNLAFAGLLAIATAIPVVAVIAVVGLYLKEETDEFQHQLLTQMILWATGCTLTTTTIWGLLELFTPVPRLEAFSIFSLFWVFFGIVSVLLNLRYRAAND
jgi:multisubunit Na+/H+ antiporter MnhB subunit